ncbi:uncharacterized protein LOC119179368 [Rhipicephalus microplus]|uniref:uncharacterized protein LOC119179368 n=1 Tax=Rhipicephalus microplus TaxID=6941 RepID=UPI003F6C69C1
MRTCSPEETESRTDGIHLPFRNMDVLYVSSGEDFVPPPSSLVPSLPPGDSEWVLLNVGGQYFATTRATLTSSEPRSKLAGLFSVGPNAADFAARRDAQGAYMFDRDPAYFRVVLNYLRYRKVMLDKDVSPTAAELRNRYATVADKAREEVRLFVVQGPFSVLEEAKYFGIEGLVHDLGKGSRSAFGRIRELEAAIGPAPVESGTDRPFTRQDVLIALARIPAGDLRFQAADFTGADLSHMDLNHIKFKRAKMEKCDLSHSILNHSVFDYADLREAKLEKAQLLGAKFNHANLSGVFAKSCVMGQQGDVSANIANLEGAKLNDAVLDGSKMYGVNLKKAEMNKVSLADCDMRTAILTGVTLLDCNLQKCDMQDVVLG